MRGEGARNEDTQNVRFLWMQSDGFTNRKIIFDCAMKGARLLPKFVSSHAVRVKETMRTCSTQ
jgi:hypothetical protein